MSLSHQEDFGLAPKVGEGNLSPVDFRFFTLPAHQVVNHPSPLSPEGVLEPELPLIPEGIDRALFGAEFRDVRARDRLRQLLQGERGPQLASPSSCGPSAIFAQPPGDLPALLRMADQLDLLAAQDAGEKALIWKCSCGTRYAVPVALVRQVSIKCERCGKPVELTLTRSLGEESLLEPAQGAVNAVRKQLAVFFREAMARGWPVLVCADR